MIDPTDEVAQARSNKLSNTWMINPLIAEIFQALLDFGGSAHCDAVVDQIAWRRSRATPSPGLKREIVEAFEIHRDRARASGLPPQMHLPFGDGSQRWALTPKVREFADRYRTANGSLAGILASFEQPRDGTQRKPAEPPQVWNFNQRLADRRQRMAKRQTGEA